MKEDRRPSMMKKIIQREKQERDETRIMKSNVAKKKTLTNKYGWIIFCIQIIYLF